jgi:uncharacterized membrane protein (UPF0127 family)
MKNLGMKFNFKRFVFFIFGGAILGLIIFNVPKTLDAEGLKQFNRDLKNYNVKLQIFNPTDEVIADFMVLVADDDYKKMYGLMNLKEMPKNHGMLFNFDKTQIVTMWMKNTLMPLDMLFIDDNDLIVNIKHDAVVQSYNRTEQHELLGIPLSECTELMYIYFGSNAACYVAWDVTDPLNIKVISNRYKGITSGGYYHQAWFTTDKNDDSGQK